MAYRSDREPGHPAERPRIIACKAEWDPARGYHQGQQSGNGCINRPDTRLHPTNAPDRQIATCNAGAIHTRRLGYHGCHRRLTEVRRKPTGRFQLRCDSCHSRHEALTLATTVPLVIG
jgi:ribosomal protein L44E